MIGRIKAGGGSKINGLVQEYTAGENIESGEFVKMYNNVYFSDTTFEDLYTMTDVNGSCVLKLTDTTFILFVSKYYNSGNIYAYIGTMTDTGLSVESQTLITSISASVTSLQAYKLSNNKFFLWYKESTSNKCVVGEINNDTISFGTVTTISIGSNIQATTYNNGNNILIVTTLSSRNVNLLPISINNLEITTGTSTTLNTSSSSNMGQRVSLTKITETRVVCVYNLGNNLYGAIIDINNITITITANSASVDTYINYSLSGTNFLYYNDDYIYLVSSQTSSYLYCEILRIQNNTLTSIKQIALTSSYSTIYTFDGIIVKENIMVGIGYVSSRGVITFMLQFSKGNVIENPTEAIFASGGSQALSSKHNFYQLTNYSKKYMTGKWDLVYKLTDRTIITGVTSNQATMNGNIKTIIPNI